MKAISLWQPWASLVAIGAKRIETRSWAMDHTGPLVIHAAKKWDGELKRLTMSEPFKRALIAGGCTVSSLPGLDAITLPLGKLVAVVDLVACIRVVSRTHNVARLDDCTVVTGDEFSFGDYGVGRFGWHLKNVRRLPTPIPWVGRQGPFDVPDHVLLDAVAAGVDSAEVMPTAGVVTTPAASLFDADNRRG